MPRIKTTRTVKIALWALRIYLLVLLTLIGIKFARSFSKSQPAPQIAPAVSSTSAPAAGGK